MTKPARSRGPARDRRSRGLSGVLALLIGITCGPGAAAQEAQPPQAASPKTAATGEISAEQMAKSNNPLADMNALNLHNYWMSAIRGVPDDSINTMNLRGVMVVGRQIVRATVPLTTAPLGGGLYASGLGDINVFDAIRLTADGAKTDVAVGPLLVVPSATDNALGQGKWQAGGAAVVMHPLAGGSMVGALVTYQTDFAGDAARAGTSVAAVQPILTLGMGGGLYARSTGIWVFDLENNRALIPFGIGIGRVFKGMGGIINVFVEPQFTMYSKGDQQPAFQLFTGLMMQWAKKPKA